MVAQEGLLLALSVAEGRSWWVMVVVRVMQQASLLVLMVMGGVWGHGELRVL